jgi:hypothetical protein
MTEVTDRSHLYRVNPFKRVQYNNYVKSTPPNISGTDSFLQKVDDNIYEFRKPQGKDEYIPIITISPSEIDIISQTSPSVQSNMPSDQTIDSVEKEIVSGNELINEGVIKDNSQYPLLLAARLAFNDFKEKAKRTQVLKLLFKQKLDNKNQPINETSSTAPNTTDSESVDELLKTQDNDKNNVLHLLVKGFDKNAVVEPETSTQSTKATSEYIAEVTEFRDTLRNLMYIPTVTASQTASSTNPIVENALQRIVNNSIRTNITALNEKNSNGDTPYDLFLDHYSSTPFETKNKSTLGLTQISVALNETDDVPKLTAEQQDKLDNVYEEIIDLLKPNEKESNKLPTIEPSIIQREMYYAYGEAVAIKNNTNYNSITLINPTYHEFIKINKRLHSIPKCQHYDLTSYNGTYYEDTFDVSIILKDFDITPYKQCAIGFYTEKIGNDDKPIILDLFLYNTTPTEESI